MSDRQWGWYLALPMCPGALLFGLVVELALRWHLIGLMMGDDWSVVGKIYFVDWSVGWLERRLYFGLLMAF